MCKPPKAIHWAALGVKSDTRAGKLLSMGGSYVWKSSSYSAQRALAEEAATASELAKGTVRVLGGASLLYSGYNFVSDPTWGRFLELGISGLSIVPRWGWIVGGVYFAADMGWKAYSGKTIQQSVDGE